MIDGLIRWSLRHRMIVVALAVAFLIWGAWTVTRIPLDVLPDLTAPTVTILAEAPGMDPLEIESLVTFPIESALNGAAGVRRVRSATVVGVAIIWVEFDWGQDINRARQTVAEKLTLEPTLHVSIKTRRRDEKQSLLGYRQKVCVLKVVLVLLRVENRSRQRKARRNHHGQRTVAANRCAMRNC